MADVDYLDSEVEYAEADERPSGITLIGALRTLRRYAAHIALGVVGAAVAYVLFAVILLLVEPVQRNVTLGFRLDFPGADAGVYPNGVKFSGSDIIDTPILKAAFDTNQLERFTSFSEFARSIVVLEANSAYQQLAYEYEAKLSDPKLSPVERQRLEAEFNQKRESLQKNDYAIVFATREGVSRIPPSVSSKVLYDILRAWADFTANRRQVLAYRVPLISDQMIARQLTAAPDALSKLLSLRNSARALRGNANDLAALPGAEVIRSTKRNTSLAELDMELMQVERSRIEYLINAMVRAGLTDRARAVTMLESQLAYDSRNLASAEERAQVIRGAFEDYARSRSAQNIGESPAPQAQDAGSAQTVILNETFLDKMVALAQDADDAKTRQRYVDDIRQAALAAVPLRSSVKYEQELLASLRAGVTGPGVSAAELSTGTNGILTELQAIALDLSDIRQVLSRSLTASGQMYTVTMPPTASVERSVSLAKLAVGAVLVVILALIIGIVAALVHAYFRGDFEPRHAPSHAS